MFSFLFVLISSSQFNDQLLFVFILPSTHTHFSILAADCCDRLYCEVKQRRRTTLPCFLLSKEIAKCLILSIGKVAFFRSSCQTKQNLSSERANLFESNEGLPKKDKNEFITWYYSKNQHSPNYSTSCLLHSNQSEWSYIKIYGITTNSQDW